MHSAETPGNTGERDRRTLVVIENRKPSEQKAVGFLHHTAGGKDDQRDDTLGRAGGWLRGREHSSRVRVVVGKGRYVWHTAPQVGAPLHSLTTQGGAGVVVGRSNEQAPAIDARPAWSQQRIT